MDDDPRKRIRNEHGAPAEVVNEPQKEEPQFNAVDEASLGITEFTSPKTAGFFGVLKQRFD